MDSQHARKLYVDHATALAYVDVELPNGQRSIGSAFHVGDGVFVTARHVVDGNRIVEVRITEPIGQRERGSVRNILKGEVSHPDPSESGQSGDAADNLIESLGYHRPLELSEGPYLSTDDQADVAVFRVKTIHPQAAAVRLGIHFDDWIFKFQWQLSTAIILGYPPIPMVDKPMLISAHAEIHTYVLPYHSKNVHFILSAIPRGGFSGGLAIHEDGDALGVITSSFLYGGKSEESGFFAVLSIEAILLCLGRHNLYLDFQRKYHESVLGIPGTTITKFLSGADARRAVVRLPGSGAAPSEFMIEQIVDPHSPLVS